MLPNPQRHLGTRPTIATDIVDLSSRLASSRKRPLPPKARKVILGLGGGWEWGDIVGRREDSMGGARPRRRSPVVLVAAAFSGLVSKSTLGEGFFLPFWLMFVF
ncbi:hypothetical protein TIFTF001_003926 [Ficus carica]|uniref:Uncharacterized protein n=1 Tax=Ficus carica TaxID=3494 RepID=A0AA88A2F1_FICCA|nr:hypothetical protein TIFTF001_003926 [Ficus carica]